MPDYFREYRDPDSRSAKTQAQACILNSVTRPSRTLEETVTPQVFPETGFTGSVNFLTWIECQEQEGKPGEQWTWSGGPERWTGQLFVVM